MSNKSEFNRKAIMIRAWQFYRDVPHKCTSLAKGFIRKRFANTLKAAWAEAKYAARKKTSPEIVKTERIEQIKAHIFELDCAPLGMRITNQRNQLLRELRELEAA